MTKRVTNTASQDPMLTMLDMMSNGGPLGAIERSEARGQRELVAAAVLPTQGLLQPKERVAWEAMGIVIGDVVEGDDVFTNVTLPTGWAKRATDHSMWSDLVDSKGRKRAAIFYKAAFYDRSAFIRPVTRFSISRDYDRPDRMDVASSRVLEGETVRFTSSDRRMTSADGKPLPCNERDAATSGGDAECKAWLIENGYPDFANPAAYWD